MSWFLFLVFLRVDFLFSFSSSSFQYLGGSSFDSNNQILFVTQAVANANGAAWYKTPVSWMEPFNVTFRFQLKNSSITCQLEPQESLFCDGRGANGFALVFQNSSNQLNALGDITGMGYKGIEKSIAIEFDTWFDEILQDPFNDHISVHTNGNMSNSPHHTSSIGLVSVVPNFLDLVHIVHIEYFPEFTPFAAESPFTPVEMASTSHLVELSNQYDGFGAFVIHLDNLVVLRTTVSLSGLLNSTSGYIGFTASTNADSWQSHEILDFKIN